MPAYIDKKGCFCVRSFNYEQQKREGWKAFEAHLRWADCPYSKGTNEYDAWQVGFEKAFHHYSA